MFADHFYLNRRRVVAAAAVFWLFTSAGCSLFKSERWNIDHYRDPQALSVEKSLSREKPIVASPF